MRRQLNYSGSLLSKFLLLAIAVILCISIAFSLRQHYSLFRILISVVVLGVIGLVLYINFFGERLETDDRFLYWKPVWSSSFIQIPVHNIKSARVVSRPPVFDGLTLLMNCRIGFSMGEKEFVIKFQMRQRDEELLNHLRNQAASKIPDQHI
jgi:hypothetical protein